MGGIATPVSPGEDQAMLGMTAAVNDEPDITRTRKLHSFPFWIQVIEHHHNAGIPQACGGEAQKSVTIQTAYPAKIFMA